MAAKATTAPVILAESGDNPTGGGVGDNGLVLKALIERDWQDALIAGITDRPAVDACFAAGVGAELDLSIGATLDPSGVSATARFTVLTLVEGDGGAFAQAVVRTGGITVVLAARRRPYHNFADFELLGLDPRSVGLLVVKSGYLSPDLAPIANPNLMALTEGVVNQDIPQLASLHRAPGIYPWEPDATFTPAPVPSARA